MARQKVLEIHIKVEDSTGARQRTLHFTRGGGTGPDDLDLDQVVAMFFGTTPTQEPHDILGGFYLQTGQPAKAQKVRDQWLGTGAHAPQANADLVAVMVKNPGCDSVVGPLA
jgi:hypothetical protein